MRWKYLASPLFLSSSSCRNTRRGGGCVVRRKEGDEEIYPQLLARGCHRGSAPSTRHLRKSLKYKRVLPFRAQAFRKMQRHPVHSDPWAQAFRKTLSPLLSGGLGAPPLPSAPRWAPHLLGPLQAPHRPPLWFSNWLRSPARFCTGHAVRPQHPDHVLTNLQNTCAPCLPLAPVLTSLAAGDRMEHRPRLSLLVLQPSCQKSAWHRAGAHRY